MAFQAVGGAAADEAELATGGAAVAVLPEAGQAAEDKPLAVAAEGIG